VAAVVAVQVAAVAVGVVLALAVLGSAIKTVVLPRAVTSLITRAVFRGTRHVFDVLARPSLPFERRDRVLALYGPVTLVVLPGTWVALTLVAFTLIFWGTGLHPFREAFVMSGSSLLTLGFEHPGDLVHVVIALLEAALGLGLVALVISSLPTLYGTFNRREQLVGQLEVRAGIPPSPAEMLARYARIGPLEAMQRDLFPAWEQWFSDVEESHTSVPVLVFFRSPQPGRSWITAAGCVLDTAAIYDSVVDRPRDGAIAVTIRSGFLCLRRVADVFRIPYDADPRPDDAISITRREFDLLCVELQAAGIPLRADRDRAWRDFAGWRVNYDRVLLSLTALVVAPPARWSTDRVPAEAASHLRRTFRRSR